MICNISNESELCGGSNERKIVLSNPCKNFKLLISRDVWAIIKFWQEKIEISIKFCCEISFDRIYSTIIVWLLKDNFAYIKVSWQIYNCVGAKNEFRSISFDAEFYVYFQIFIEILFPPTYFHISVIWNFCVSWTKQFVFHLNRQIIPIHSICIQYTVYAKKAFFAKNPNFQKKLITWYLENPSTEFIHIAGLL